jgi:hypothetical protein
MASQGDQTRVGGGPPPPRPSQPAADSGIELTTLLLSAIASAAAAYITSKIWAPGTLFSAAMSPVIVALVKEGLRKPTEVVANVAAPSRWTRTSAGDPGLVPGPGALPPSSTERVDPDAPHVVLPPVVASEHGPVNVYSTRSNRLRWRLAVITGLLGFVICVLFFTVPELIAGQSIGRGSGEATTIFGGSRHRRSSTQTTTTKTSTATTAKTTTDQTSTTTQTTTAPTTATPSPSTAAPPPSTATPPTSATPSSTAPGSAPPPTP